MALKYLKNIEVNLNNVLIMVGDLNIRDNNWDTSYPHHSTYTDTLREIADSFNLEISITINQIPTRYTNNTSEPNLVIDLMFLWTNSEELDTYTILLDLQISSNYTSLMVNIIVKEKFI